MKNGQKYAKEIQNMLNEQCYYCALWHVRHGFDRPVNCGMIPASVEAGSKEFNAICDKCLDESLEWLNEEYKEPILTDEEKDIVESIFNVIHKFGCTVIAVRKRDVENGDCFIRTTFKNIVTGRLDLMDSPYVNNEMFKGMKTGKEYTLEELGLENVNG